MNASGEVPVDAFDSDAVSGGNVVKLNSSVVCGGSAPGTGPVVNFAYGIVGIVDGKSACVVDTILAGLRLLLWNWQSTCQ